MAAADAAKPAGVVVANGDSAGVSRVGPPVGGDRGTQEGPDINALRAPGSEVKEAYMPTFMISGSYELRDNLTTQSDKPAI